MAGSKSGGFTLEFQKQSELNLKKQMDKLGKIAPNLAFKMIVRLLFDIKTLAQQKLKSDRHIITSRLRNSIYVKTIGQKFAKANNSQSYQADGKTYSKEFNVALLENEGAVGTNVEYADAIEFGYPPHTIEAKNGGFLSWIPKAQGKVQFTSANNKTTTRNYYKDSSGANTLDKQGRVFAKSVKHPGFAGDSFMYWALKHIDTEKRGRETAKELLNGIK